MNFNAAEFRKLILPTIMALVLTVAGAALIWLVNGQLLRANATFSGVKNDHVQARERLARISEEEREVKERIEVYRRLRDEQSRLESQAGCAHRGKWPGLL